MGCLRQEVQEPRSCARLLLYAGCLDTSTCSSEQREVRLELRFVSLLSEDRGVVSCFTRRCRVTSPSPLAIQERAARLRHVVRAGERQQSKAGVQNTGSRRRGLTMARSSNESARVSSDCDACSP